MAFESLPAEYDEFFKTGVLPEGLKAEAPAPTPMPAAAPAPTPTPAAAETPAPAPTPTPAAAPDTSVYEHALKLAEQQRTILEKQLAELQGKVDKFTATPAPDPNTDPLGYINHQMKALQDKLDSLAQQGNEAKTLQDQHAQQQAFVGAVNSQIKAFEAANPDYQDAYKHMISMRTQDYIDSGMTPTEAKAAVSNDEVAIAARALQQGKNPAEIVYNMAKRYGYAKAEPKVDTTNKLDTIKKGLEASKGIDERGTQPTEVTLDSLENMSEADMNRMVEKDWEKLFGKSKGIFG